VRTVKSSTVLGHRQLTTQPATRQHIRFGGAVIVLVTVCHCIIQVATTGLVCLSFVLVMYFFLVTRSLFVNDSLEILSPKNDLPLCRVGR